MNEKKTVQCLDRRSVYQPTKSTFMYTLCSFMYCVKSRITAEVTIKQAMSFHMLLETEYIVEYNSALNNSL